MGLVTVLYVFVKVSLFLPQWVEVRAFSILIVFLALSFEVLICSLNVSLGSKVSPSILGLRIVGSRVLSSCSDSSSLYSAGSGVKSVVIVLLALGFRSFAFVQVVVVVVDPTPPTCCQQSPAPEIMWQPAVSPPRWQGKAPLCRDSSRGPG